MAGKRTPMSKIVEIRRYLNLGLSDRKIARALGVSRNTVAEIKAGSTDGDTLCAAAPTQASWVDTVDWDRICAEHQSGTTLEVLWEEEAEKGNAKVQYPAFWKRFRKKFPNLKGTMVRVFAPGSRAEIDYCDGLPFFCVVSGEIVETQLFVGVLCHSRYAFAEFTLSQKSQDFLASHMRMLAFFQGVPEVISPDNLKSAVSRVHRYDPEINPAYTKLAAHYDFGVVPALVRSPKYKAIVERTVQIFQRWFYGKVRHRTFTSLVELNACLREHLEIFNQKKHRIFRRSRAEMFAAEKLQLRALPENDYCVSTHTTARVHPDCHTAFDKNYYSVPYILRGIEIDIWATANTVEFHHKGERVAFHARRTGHGLFSTDKQHYPEAARAYAETSVQQLLEIAAAVGPNTHILIEKLLNTATPLRYLRRAQGIVRLGKDYGNARLELACERANSLGQSSYPFIEKMLKTGRVKITQAPIRRGENCFLRGQELFH
jgi:transposase